MVSIFSRIQRVSPLVIACAAAGILASCAPLVSEPEPIAAENPSVTYKYDTEQELLEASERARAFCSQYQSTTYATTRDISTDVDGRNTVEFECVPTAQSAMAPVAPTTTTTTSGLNYTYRTDQDLLRAAQSAEDYCMRSGLGTRTIQNIVPNVDGSKTVTFQCVAR